jgi:hypothetical protein
MGSTRTEEEPGLKKNMDTLRWLKIIMNKTVINNEVNKDQWVDSLMKPEANAIHRNWDNSEYMRCK